MKHLFLLCALIMSGYLWAQDTKYLAGAVPEENGKVVFTKVIETPSVPKEMLYEQILQWATGYFTEEFEQVAYADREKGEIVAAGQTMLVFQNNAIALDRAKIFYRANITCANNQCTIKVNNIRYEYNVSYQGKPEKFAAENCIVDKYSMNKKGTKLNRVNGKFREKTVDLVNELFASASAALGVSVTTNSLAANKQPNAPVVTINNREGYVAMVAGQLPATMTQMIPESSLQLLGVSHPNDKQSGCVWKGMSDLLGKTVALVTIDPQCAFYKHLENSESYELHFFKPGEKEQAWLIIRCSKQGETTDGTDTTLIGVVSQIWIK